MNINETSELWHYLANTTRPILLYGMGDGADKIINELAKYGKSVDGIFASDEFVRGQRFHDMTVQTLSQLERVFFEPIILQAFASSLPSVLEHIDELSRRYEYYVPDVPVFASDVFNMEFFRKNECKLDEVYSLLCDDESRRVLEGILNYKLSGRIEYLRGTECELDGFIAENLPVCKYRTYCDGGAYRGESSLGAVKLFPNLSSIYAFEPDPSSFKKLSSVDFGEKVDVKLFNGSLGSHDGLCDFVVRKNRSSSLLSSRTEADGKHIRTIRQYALDSVVADDNCFVKLDVEGNEYEALLGCEGLIKKGCDMQISLYHKSEDIFALPLHIHSVDPTYRLYIRRIPYIPPWDISLFAIHN